MPTFSDIAFDCPHCRGPLLAEASHTGMNCECPHCYVQLEVPRGDVLNKEKFIEPEGLRRVLKQVKDQEWETLRRKLRAAKARNAELEAELHRVQAASAEKAAAPKQSEDHSAEIELLRTQLSEITEQLTLANQAFVSDRKQQDSVVEQLRHEVEMAQSETESLRKTNDEFAKLIEAIQEDSEHAKEESLKSGAQAMELTDALERMGRELADCQVKLEAEQAKVLVMEAAGISIVDAAEQNAANEQLIQELQIQIAELRKSNDSLRAARDKAHAQVAELQKEKSGGLVGNQQLEVMLGHLEANLAEALGLLAARKQSNVSVN